MPKVSVIVSVHNAGKYLQPLLESIINQTLKDIEILLIDDGSIDGSRQLLELYAQKDNRIKIFFRTKSDKEHFGQKASADIGRAAAQGTYIMMIDHDDELIPNALEVLYNATENETLDVIQGRNFTRSEEGQFVYCTPDFFPTKRIIYKNEVLDPNDMWHHLIGAPCALWACLIRREFQKDIVLEDFVGNDTNFIWKLKILADTFCYIPDYVYIQNEHIDSTSGHGKRKDILCMNIFLILRSIESFLKMQAVNQYMWITFSLFKFHMLYVWSENNFFTPEEYQDFIIKAREELLDTPSLIGYMDEEYTNIYLKMIGETNA